MIKLRDYQSQMKTDIYAAWHAGARNVLAVAATGSGKTVIFSDILHEHKGATVAIAHRQELVSQISVALARNGVRHRIIGAQGLAKTCVQLHMSELGKSYYDPSAICAVAGVDTLIRMDQRDPFFAQVTLGVCDEAHHIAGGPTGNKWFKATMMFPNARWLGVTATPCRADGQGLGRHADGIMDSMILAPTMRDLINRGFLTEYRLFAPPSDIDLTNVPISAGGDFSPEPLRKAVHKSHIVGDVVAHYQRLAPGKLGVTFAVDVESAIDICEAFKAAGVPAEIVSAKTPDAQRIAVLRRFRNRQTLQLVNVDLFGEGFDLPAIEVVSMARPTQSFPLYAQQFGRSLRLMVDDQMTRLWDQFSDEDRCTAIAQSNKPKAIIIDHVGNVHRHGLPDAPQAFTLNRREKRRNAPVIIPVRTCPNCGASYERIHISCPYCGGIPVPVSRSTPEQVDGDLCELDPRVLAAMRAEVDAPPRFPYEAPQYVRSGIMNKYSEKQQAQGMLRETMALWCGQRTQETDGPELRRAQKEFYLTFGVDVLSAQALPRKEAEELTERIRERI